MYISNTTNKEKDKKAVRIPQIGRCTSVKRWASVSTSLTRLEVKLPSNMKRR
jgi:hypothetical protein